MANLKRNPKDALQWLDDLNISISSRMHLFGGVVSIAKGTSF